MTYTLAVDANNSGRYTDNCSAIGNVLCDYRVRADLNVGAHANPSNDLGACPNEHIVSQDRRPAFFRTDSHAMLEDEVAACADLRVDDCAETMQKHKTGTKFGAAPDDSVTYGAIDSVEDTGERLHPVSLAKSHHAI